MSFKELTLGFVVWVAITLLVAGSRWSRLYNTPALTTDQPVDIYLAENTGGNGLAQLLANQDLIENKEEFDWAVKTLHWGSFKAGHYEFEKDVSYEGLLSKLGRGLQDPIQLTILPGYLQPQLIQRISDSFRFDSVALKKTLEDSIFLSQQGVDTAKVIGHLYPNTYSFYWTTSPKKVVNRLLDTFQEGIVSKYKDRFQELDKSVNEIITLASIIEWEAGNENEKVIISGLYWNRLEKGMRLQADPTVNFAVGERRRLTFKDYKVDHPYNTYLYSGLPPGPITNPSESSIKAALYPKEHNYFYMVASPEGNHNFSKTFQEHQQKSAEWRAWLQEQYRIKRERENENKEKN